MKLQLSFFTVLILFLGTFMPQANAQRNCGSMEVLEQQQSIDDKLSIRMEAIEQHTRHYMENEADRAVNGTITIPVVFHIVYNTASENISDAQIMSQLQVLNDDFRRLNSDADGTWPQAADSEIEFCLATVDPNGNSTTGITRTSTSTTSFSSNDNMKFNSSGGKDAWPAGDYLNFWVCDLSGGLLGYAQFPGGSSSTDGVVCDYQYTGTIGTATAPFDLGRTATHEVGHWLNLRHIWGDGNCNADDFVSDTPTSDASNGGCAVGHVSCGTVDMVQNYMDYSDDACMNLYTEGQKTRMRAIFDTGGARASLLNSGGCGNAPPPATCTDGIQNGNETGVDCGGPDCAPCPCSGTMVTVSITLDNYPEETSWSITNSGGSTVASGGTYGSQPDGSTISIDVCLADGCYDFVINDAYGDGICCGYGNGSYTVSGGGNTLASGGSFASSETTNFCLGGGPAPTCTDGVQNGNETDVDCGGPDCPACPTCSDGVQNGDETGVDCGGPDCAPCGGGGCTYVTIDNHNFESGWGIWNDGGSDCRRSSRDAAYANGTYCVRLRDNTSTSTMTTDNLNLSGYDELTVEWGFYSRSMENNEDFWVQISNNGGSSYTTVAAFAQGTDFVNNTFYTGSVVISGPFASNSRLRFRNDASGNSDWIYIDDVNITGCANGARDISEENTDDLADPTTIDVSSVNTGATMKVFPNPARDLVNFDLSLNQLSESANMMITDMNGKIIHRRVLDGQLAHQRVQFDVSQQTPGIYMVIIATENERITKKFVVIR